jgi:ABC-type amino acid transport substrate-binding protein
MHTVTMALLGTCAVAGAVRWKPRALARYAAVTATVTIAIVGGTRIIAERMLGQQQAAADALSTMHLDRHGEAAVLQASAPVYRSDPGSRLAAIRARQTLRVGYLSDALPFAFFNGQGDLVGLDIAMMHRLAMELNVRVEFVPVGRNDTDGRSFAAERLRSGYCDILVGGFGVTTRRAEVMQLSTPYLDETVAFVVRDADRRRFETWDSIRATEGLTLAIPNVPYYVDMLRARLPRARLETAVTIESLFGSGELRADAIALPAERGSAWTLRYPQLSVVIPTPGLVKIPLAYATPPGEPELSSFLNTWLELKRRDGTVDDLYQYWILGRDAVASGPRWSIIRDVLGWVN